jgi:phage terminase small subunit
MALTDKQQRFVEEYCGAAKFNASEATRRAGYAGNSDVIKTAGSKLMANPEIADAIQSRMERLAAKSDITAERVIRELGLLGFSNMLDYMRVPEQGDPYIDLSTMTRDQAAALTEVSVDTVGLRTDDEGEPRQIVRTKIKVADKKAALELLGKHLGVFKDAETSVNLNMPGNISVSLVRPDDKR